MYKTKSNQLSYKPDVSFVSDAGTKLMLLDELCKYFSQKLTLLRMSQNLYVRLGFLGNQPFFTRSSCSKTSLIVQKEEKANTPRRDETSMLSVLNEAATPAIPNIRKIHQHFVPQ